MTDETRTGDGRTATSSQALAARLALFDELADLATEERAARLEALRAEDPDAAAHVERLLAVDAEAATGPLQRLEVEVADAVARHLVEVEAAAAPHALGAWTLVERIGSGGMGEVWRGTRNAGGFAQEAAIKLVRFGMASETVLARFARERQLLARLVHPAIARLYDGGVAPDGRPWFAMELIDGEPIDRFAARLGLEEKLRLFAAVADTVAFAHRNLVVHRDLKPSNILVTAGGEPKLLDFGLAKLLEAEDDPGLTRSEHLVMTPAYAAPEQIVGEPATTATDVYALGVVLYEILAGRRPHARAGKSGAALADEVSRESIERPSSAARRAATAVAAAAADGAIRRGAWRRLVGDLDLIVLQALRREPERRYATAAAFADDIRRFLADLPVTARADSLAYRASKFLARHAWGVAAAGLVFMALIAGLVGTTWQARRAQRQAARAERVQAFLVDLFEAADPDRSRGSTLTARELLAEGAIQLDSGLDEEPDVRAALLDTVSQLERRLGLFDAAEQHARAAIALRRRGLTEGAPDTLEAARARLSLAEALDGRGDMLGAQAEHTRAFAVLAVELGPEAPEIERARSGELSAFMDAGNAKGGLALARQIHEEHRLRLGEGHEETARALYGVGQMLELDDQYTEAEAAYRSSLQVLERSAGAGELTTELVRMALAEVVGYRGRRSEAIPLFERAIAEFTRTRGENHVMVAQARLKMALVLINDGRLTDADRALEAAYRTFAALGHFDAASCLRMLGNSLLAQGRLEEAIARYQEAIERFRAQVGPQHMLTVVARGNLGTAQVRLGRLDEGRATLDAVITDLTALAGPESDTLRQPLLSRGEAERKAGRPQAALDFHRRVKAIAETNLGPNHIGVANAWREIALDFEALGGRAGLAEARSAIERAIAIRSAADPNVTRLADCYDDAARITGALGDREAARAARARAQELRASAPAR